MPLSIHISLILLSKFGFKNFIYIVCLHCAHALYVHMCVWRHRYFSLKKNPPPPPQSYIMVPYLCCRTQRMSIYTTENPKLTICFTMNFLKGIYIRLKPKLTIHQHGSIFKLYVLQ